MKGAMKILIVLICTSLCIGGGMFSLKPTGKEDRAKTKVVPVNNRAKPPAIRIWVEV
jgi:hypothetical protein